MFKGFNLKLDIDFYRDNDIISFDQCYKLGKESFDKNKKTITDTLDKYIGLNGVLDGSKLQSDWFPQIKADVFISHSHGDEDYAIALAGWLNEAYGLTSFIDSCIWGYANDLLKNIDDVYSMNDDKTFYDYTKRNYSTSHIHMMLSASLSMMIDKTECLFFLNTPKSVKSSNIKVSNNKDAKKDKTLSPWIYSEIAMSYLIRKRSKNSHRDIVEFSKNLNENKQLAIEYDLPLEHLTDIDHSTLMKVYEETDHDDKYEALDNLYKITSTSKQLNG